MEFVTLRPAMVARVEVNVSIVPEIARNTLVKNDVVVALDPVALLKTKSSIAPLVAVRFVAN